MKKNVKQFSIASRKTKRQILRTIDEQHAQKLLTAFANARDSKYLMRHHAADIEMPADTDDGFIALSTHDTMEQIAKFLRKAFDARDDRHFEWYVSRILLLPGLAHRWSVMADEPPDHVTALEAALTYMRRNRSRALRCPNPDCAAPYFFKKKQGQKFCSSECARPSLLESKRIWVANYRAAKKERSK